MCKGGSEERGIEKETQKGRLGRIRASKSDAKIGRTTGGWRWPPASSPEGGAGEASWRISKGASAAKSEEADARKGKREREKRRKVKGVRVLGLQN